MQNEIRWEENERRDIKIVAKMKFGEIENHDRNIKNRHSRS